MSRVLIDVLYGLVMATAGGLCVWASRAYARHRSPANAEDETVRARKVLTQLHEWTVCVSDNVDEHSNRVEEISEELRSQEVPEVDAVLAAVAKIVQGNEQMQQELAEAKGKLQEQAQIIESQAAEVRTDALTRLANRRAFDDELDRRFAEYKRHGTPFCVMLLDLDNFKTFNDQYGHQAGDEVLRGVAGVLRQEMRDIDLVARYGGEEFAVILPRTSVDEARTPAERARDAIEQATFRFEGTDLSITASIGVAQLRSSEHPSLLLRRADAAMYASKQAGRNNTHWHDGEAIHPVTGGQKCVASSGQASDQQSVAKESESHNHSVQATKPRVTAQSDSPTFRSSKGPSEPQEVTPEQPDTGLQADKTDTVADLESLDDPLAELGDRTAFCHAVRRRLAEWKRGGPTVSLVLLEIDAFGQIVGQHGEARGRLLVNSVGNAILAVVREMDFVASYGPGRFGLLQASVSHAELLSLAKRLHQAVAECGWRQEDVGKELTVSSGLVAATEGDDLIRLLSRAEEALRNAKEEDGCSSYYHNGQWAELAHAGEEVSKSQT